MINPILSAVFPGGLTAKLPVLIWHRVLPEPDPLFPEEMHAERFDRTIGWLSRHFRVLPLGEAVARMRTGQLPARALAITFDDGYADNLHVAHPILRKHGVSATFFIATGFLNGGRMWNDTIIEAIRRWQGEACDAGQLGQYRLDSISARRQAIDAILGRAKYLEFTERSRFVDEFARRCGAPLPDNLMMTSDEVRALAAGGQEIGAHTRLHPILARLPADQARSEILDGRAELEDMLGSPVRLFAYPNGRPGQDYTAEHVHMVREAGFDAAVSTAAGASRTGDDLFQLRRFSPWDQRRFAFLMRLVLNARQSTPPALASLSR